MAADEIGGIQHQRVKVQHGADGSATDVSTASPMPVQVHDGTDAAVVSAAGALQVDVASALPAGTNAIGKLAANSGVDIGDVDVTSCALPTGASTSAKQDTIIGHLDGVEGLLTTIDGDTGALAACASGSELQVDIVGALPAGANAIGKLAANTGVDIGDVDVTSVVPGTGATNLGKAEDGGHTSGDVGVMVLGVRIDTPNAARADTDLDYLPIGLYRDGSIRIAPPESDFAALGSNHVKKYYTSTGAATDGIIWSPAAGKRWYVTDIFIQVSAAATVTLEDDKAGGDEAIWKAELAANSGWSHSFSTPLFSGEDAADLIITTTAGNVYVTVTGYEI